MWLAAAIYSHSSPSNPGVVPATDAAPAAKSSPPPGTGDVDDPNALAPPPPKGPPGPTVAPPCIGPLKLPRLSAASAILMDADTGQVIFEKDADAQRPMASTTKIMTALLFCENVPDDATIVASKNACRIHNCSLHLQRGEKLTAHDLLRGMLIRSANDACVAAAEKVSGTEAAFVAKMNARAAELGALHTHFSNPHGLTAPDHYTTARDLATIARAVVKQQRIMDVVKLLDCTIERSIKKSDRNLHNYSHFVGRFPGAEGLKSGWTTPSGHCYVGVASQKGWRLISVVLKSDEYGTDTTALMSFGFKNFQPVHVADANTPEGDAPVRAGMQKTVPVESAAELRVVVRNGQAAGVETRPRFDARTAPIKQGEPMGVLEARLGTSVLTSVPLLAERDVKAEPEPSAGPQSQGRKMLLGFGVFMVGLVSLRYGARNRTRLAAFAKGARGRRHRFTANLRDDHLLR